VPAIRVGDKLILLGKLIGNREMVFRIGTVVTGWNYGQAADLSTKFEFYQFPSKKA
jgi:hypothetical protein